MTFSFHPVAEQELNDAVDYYNGCQNGLGLQFAKEVYAVIRNILRFPVPGHLCPGILEDT